ncbi:MULTISPECIES: ATP-binding protein [Chelativorans]|jgi:signal transduction histidine kinase|uniref:histidine kinase n=1 Tax=Chelativorans sp. (strain BNC1) TaxID=266779 RepID=Q11N35_CHESB|nr:MULTISPECIES: HAMP domain-containing sensor histidine kinase [Chelativorans]
MRPTAPRVKAALPYLCLGAALVLCGWTFLRSEKYRAESDLNFSQSYEIQWRTTQIREHLARIHGGLQLAAATGHTASDLGRQVFLLNANVGQLLKLEYAPKFLRDRDIELLNGLQAITTTHLTPIVEGATDFDRALRTMPDLEQRMFEVSGTAVAHAETLNAASHIAAAASRNRFLFAVALVLAAVGYTIIHLRNVLAWRQDQYLRSFSSLYAHMTRSRVAALNLFLSYQDQSSVKHPEMLTAARDAAQQLEAITNGLGNIAYAHKDTRRERLSAILEAIRTNKVKPELRVDPDAAEAMVPATQIRLILEELLHNANAALGGNPDGKISIAAQVRGGSFRRRRELLIEVLDNGEGMSPEVLALARTPFFSTRAGSHTGLGLTGCSQMVAALRGKFSIVSRQGNGTAIRISLPIESA